MKIQILIRRATIVIFGSILLLSLTNASVLADAKGQIQNGVNAASGNNGTPSTKDLNDTLTSGINIFSAVIGVVALIMLMVGGFRYITSAGNDTVIAEAKKTIVYALIGLIIVGLSQFIVKFVLNNVG
jgi:hypothetical protein